MPAPLPKHPWFEAGEGAAPALLDEAGRVLDHAGLRAQVRAAAQALSGLGLGPEIPAALVLPNGPVMATAFLATATAGVAAPLNPAYGRAEFDFYLGDLGARLLLVAAELDTPARDVARARGIRVVEVAPGGDLGSPGAFTLDGTALEGQAGSADPDTFAIDPKATALLLHTSGTTSRPKLVPLRHRHLQASARHVAQSLALGPGDRSLGVMPLFHIHGLVASLLASLSVGGSVVCTPGFNRPRFFAWLEATRATWYSAVPTMHQAVLSAFEEDPARARAVLASSPLRLVRSSSAALLPVVFARLEAALGRPVIEAYGMTEAAHQMASNPLPPAVRKPGSVGLPAGPEIAILDAAGAALGREANGEVAIRGPNVFSGYGFGAAAATRDEAAWFRTGDLGHLDAEGYLFLSGRSKEQVNRGGEKIAPLEVDQALLTHPSVAEAIAFAVPHPELGEDLGAAVVLRPGAAFDERALRQHVADSLAYFKVPRRILALDRLPTGPTGKVLRIGLAERLGLRFDTTAPPDDGDAGDDSTAAPMSPTEEVVAFAWTEVLGRPPRSTDASFLAAGGDSMGALRLVARLRELLAVEVTLLAFFDQPTVRGLAAEVDRRVTQAP